MVMDQKEERNQNVLASRKEDEFLSKKPTFRVHCTCSYSSCLWSVCGQSSILCLLSRFERVFLFHFPEVPGSILSLVAEYLDKLRELPQSFLTNAEIMI
jgi:hypothetical protein